MPTRHSSRLAPLRAALVISAALLAAATFGAWPSQAQDSQIQLAPGQGSAEGSATVETPGAPTKVSADMLLGKWCGDTTNYTFTPTELTVTFHTGGTRVLRIDHIVAGNTSLDVHWVGKRPDGGSNNTVFGEFSADGSVMYQAANDSGDKGPRRRFRRC